MFDFAIDQEQKQNTQHGVHAHEAEQREHAVAGGDVFGVAVGGAHQAVNQPGLAAEFRGHPSGSVRDIRKRQSSAGESRASSAHGKACRATAGKRETTIMAMKMVPSPTMM